MNKWGPSILVWSSPQVEPESLTSENAPWKDGHGGVSSELVSLALVGTVTEALVLGSVRVRWAVPS